MLRPLALCLGLTAAPAFACDVALVLAVDVSGSVDPRDYRVQMDGLAQALADPQVAEALYRAEAQVMLIQWTGTSRQTVSIPWTRIDSYEAAQELAVTVANAPRAWRNFATAIGEALEMAITAFDAPEVAGCRDRVIDVSGDGVSNEGAPPEEVRHWAVERGITINALAIEQTEAGLTAYFRSNVIAGHNAFAMRAATFADYPDRIRAKLLRELPDQVASAD